MFDVTFLIGALIVIGLACVALHYSVIGIFLIVKIWAHVDHEAKAEYNRLELLVRRANKGDADAIKTCEIDSYNIKSSWWRKKRFSVRWKVVYACYGHY